MGKENWLKYVMQQKEKLERVLIVDNDKNFLNYHTYLFIYLHDNLFLGLQECNKFHVYDNVPSMKKFLM